MKFFDLDKIKNLSMEDVLSKLNYTVKTKGRSKVMLCPFHDDHHPSMVVYDHAVKCFACGAYYGIIDIVKEKEKCDFMGACKWLDEQFGPLTSPEKRGPLTSPEKRGPLTPEGGSLPVHKAKKKRTLDDYQKMIDRMSLPRVPHSSPEAAPFGGRGAFTLDYVRQHLDNGLAKTSSFYKCLRKLFDAELVNWVTELYGIGCWAVDDTMFPLIDKDLRVHNIKIQHYDTNVLSDGFFHKDRCPAWWYAKKYIERHHLPADSWHDTDCYFGEHLISRFPNDIIILVESPKNAILGSCAFPEYIWVATGNKGMLKRERLECMRDRRVIVMPDADAAEEWKQKLDKMQDIATFIMSSSVEKFKELGEKADVGDWIVNKLKIDSTLKSRTIRP